ncbi:MAG: HNH endonuclease [Elusimicrobia bacterium]|nr:HNH endonuclease [Elusimicrobiota bacterium]
MERIFQEALEALLDRKDPERRLRAKEEKAAAGHEREPRPQSVWAFAMRHIPQAVKDAVWRRDGGQCVYVGSDGARCVERGGLEFDHIVPFALGGPSNNAKNIRLLCKTHNLMTARQALGETALRRQMGVAPINGGASPPTSG